MTGNRCDINDCVRHQIVIVDNKPRRNVAPAATSSVGSVTDGRAMFEARQPPVDRAGGVRKPDTVVMADRTVPGKQRTRFPEVRYPHPRHSVRPGSCASRRDVTGSDF